MDQVVRSQPNEMPSESAAYFVRLEASERARNPFLPAAGSDEPGRRQVLGDLHQARDAADSEIARISDRIAVATSARGEAGDRFAQAIADTAKAKADAETTLKHWLEDGGHGERPDPSGVMAQLRNAEEAARQDVEMHDAVLAGLRSDLAASQQHGRLIGAAVDRGIEHILVGRALSVTAEMVEHEATVTAKHLELAALRYLMNAHRIAVPIAMEQALAPKRALETAIHPAFRGNLERFTDWRRDLLASSDAELAPL